MFNKLKNLFAKDKTEHTADITQWVNAKADENNRLIDKEAEHTSDKIEKICAKLEENLSSLENMELQNKKVPKRVEQIIEGNRTTYVKNSRNFINRIDNKIEPQTFSKTIKDELENLGHANARGTKVLSEFFRNEVVSISQQLRALISLGNQLDKCIAELKIMEIREIQRILDQNKYEESKAADMDKQIESVNLEITKNKSRKTKLQEKISEFKKSTEYKEHLTQKKVKEKITADLKQIDDKIWVMFSKIQPAMKKYARISLNDKILQKFISDPVKAAINSDLEIIGVLKDMLGSLNKGGIDLKEKRLEHAKTGARLLIEKLGRMVADRETLVHRKKQTNERIRKTYMRDLEEADYKLEHLDARIKKLKNDLENLDQQKASGHIMDNAALVRKIRTDLDIDLILDKEIDN